MPGFPSLPSLSSSRDVSVFSLRRRVLSSRQGSSFWLRPSVVSSGDVSVFPLREMFFPRDVSTCNIARRLHSFPPAKLSFFCGEQQSSRDVSRAWPGNDLRFSEACGAMSGDATARKPGKLVLLILVGVPGSGKSTFCSGLLDKPSRPWVRICQDVISTGKRGRSEGGSESSPGGKPGTKQQCLKQAAIALAEGSSVVVDRCNIDKKQRVEFVDLARKAGAEVHAVVLSYPAKVCVERAMKRVAHEGGLKGPTAAPVVYKMAKGQEYPESAEGFVRVTFCSTDGEVADVLALYNQLDSAGCLPLGVFGTMPLPPVKKQDAPAPGQKKLQAFFQKKAEKEESSCRVGEDVSSCRAADGAEALAFPSLSTGDFKFDHARAAEVIVETVAEFLGQAENRGLKLVLVDVSHSSDMLARVRVKAAEIGLDKAGFSMFVGDITKLKSKGGIRCTVIANAANWRLSPGGGGVNVAIYKAAGKDLDTATKQKAKTLSPGKALAVPLPLSSPLRRDEGVTHVIHVVGPNMNPDRPNCLNGDVVQGSKLLRDAYQNLFKCFAQAAGRSHPPNLSKRQKKN